ncbi:cytochrome P450 20A1 [Lingula anatina]|uniref:Cytochrome P450 20A1 n=1 Tax=Lingula anatina TaxID=7574 RepID=A0A1S3H4X6_LINAN|nr:cytochrome P450 20A1 [Lingula anatina]|eukprot:XP_013381185.1 cytochrome P450 20A1 [Lingula anatina]
MKSIGMLQKLSEEMVARWSQIPHGEHVPCRQGMFMFAIKAIMQSSLGNFFLQDEEVLKFWESYNTSWSDMEQRFLKEDFPQPGSEREKIFNEAKKYMYDTIAAAIEVRRKRPTTEKRKMLIDVMIENNIPYDVMQCDVLMFIIGGFHTTANSLLWALTFISAHSDVQEKMYQEVKNVLGDTGKITPDNIGQLVYTRQVIDEALRIAKIAPYAARFDDENDVKLGDYVIPAGTPIIQAINVEYNDPARWPNPNEFDPDRFSPEKVSERHPYSFQPFGFAGKRKCPGYRFAYAEVTTALANILLSFQIQGVKGQEVKASCGLLGALDDEVWITLEKRSSGSVQPMK